MTTPVLLRGHLGARFCPRYDLACDSPADAVRALCSRVPGFRDYVTEAKGGFKVLVNNQPIGIDDLGNATGGKSIRIVPVVSGASGDVGKIILGAALVAVSFYVPAAWGATGKIIGGMAMSMGSAMALGGVVGLLTSSPNAPGANGTDPSKSYLFSGGGANPTGQGGKIPVLLGRMKIQGIRISGGIDPDSGYSPHELGSGALPDGEWALDGHGGHVATKRQG